MPESMSICRSLDDVRHQVEARRRAGRTMALVPTMGALHVGHRSLMERAASLADETWVTIFVNPLQFGPGEDFERYPRAFEADAALCREAGVSVVFAPTHELMYPADRSVFVDEVTLSRGLCGASRPGHFRGVCTVVAKLFNLTQPDVAVFGEKDAQQLRIIERMVRDLDFPLRIVRAPTAREPDGLAISSRNAYLGPDEREQAVCLSRGLRQVRARVEQGERDTAVLREALRACIAEAPLARVDYIALVDDETLEPLELLDRPCLVALAVYFGKTRLIDNVTVRP